ncbi:MAG TPA: DUF4126 family protein, partial [Ktedonobacterales bacterium]
NASPLAAAVIGGALAFAMHGGKAVTRPVVTATTAGHGNPVVSVLEDILVVVGVILLLALPVIGFIFFVVLLLLVLRLIRGVFRRLRGKPASGRPAPAPMARTVSATPPGARPLGGIIGRAQQRAAAQRAAQRSVPLPVQVPSAPLPVRVAAPGMPIPIGAPVPAPAPLYPYPAPSARRAPAYPPPAPAPNPAQVPTAPMPAGIPAPLAASQGSGNTTTVQGTNPAPFAPAVPGPVQPYGGGGGAAAPQAPDTTQTMPQHYPAAAPAPWNYPGDAPTQPGTNTKP